MSVLKGVNNNVIFGLILLLHILSTTVQIRQNCSISRPTFNTGFIRSKIKFVMSFKAFSRENMNYHKVCKKLMCEFTNIFLPFLDIFQS